MTKMAMMTVVTMKITNDTVTMTMMMMTMTIVKMMMTSKNCLFRSSQGVDCGLNSAIVDDGMMMFFGIV